MQVRAEPPHRAAARVKRLIVNADDFGMAEGVNWGIVEAHRSGIVTSATLMATEPAFDHAIALAKENPDLALGVHVNLVGGRPVASPERLGGLVDRNGALPKTLVGLAVRVLGRPGALRAIEREVEAQIRRVCDAGVRPTHIDGHKHAHVLPGAARSIALAAQRSGIRRVRIPVEPRPRSQLGRPAPGRNWIDPFLTGLQARSCRGVYRRAGLVGTDRTLGIRWSGTLDVESFLFLLGSVGEGTHELMCHPGRVDAVLAARSRFQAVRERELAALTDPRLIAAVKALGIRLVSYADI